MQAIILATGENEKLSSLTVSMPSPMVPIANRPVMALAVELLARHGIKNILVNLYDRGGNIEAYFHEGNRWGVELEYLLQREPWGSAGALKWAATQLYEPCLVLPADSIVDLDIAAAIAYHYTHDAPVTCILHDPQEGEHPHAPLWLSADGRVSTGNLEPTEGTLLSATGAYIFDPSILKFIPSRTHYDTYSDLIPALLEAGVSVQGYQMSGYWNRLDSLQAYQEAQSVFLRSASEMMTDNEEDFVSIRYPSIEASPFSQGIWVGRDNIIHPNVRLTPPVYIGNGCRIGREVELGPGVVIGSNVIIDDEATVRNTTILEHTYVGQLVNLENRIVNKTLLIDIETSESTEVIDDFLLAEARPAIGGNLRRFVELGSAFFLLILTWHATFLIAVATFITTGGAVFRRIPYVAKRPGRIRSSGVIDPEIFHLLRFETTGADGNPTWLGRWLEKWQLHRLPELWNVLRGELGLVGVKPLSVEDASQIKEPWQRKRYQYPAGITGLWYIQTDPNSELNEVLITDAYYAVTRSWREDWKLVKKTPAAWLKRVSV
ncbi:MAG: sugar phosphate nucleotidyltransferase [Ardenticatenaceae bacterium]